MMRSPQNKSEFDAFYRNTTNTLHIRTVPSLYTKIHSTEDRLHSIIQSFFSNWLQLIVVFKQTLKMADIIFHQKFIIIKIFISLGTSLIWLQISVAEGKILFNNHLDMSIYFIYNIFNFIIYHTVSIYIHTHKQ